MNWSLPFTSYDFWAYLMSSIIVCAALDFAQGAFFLTVFEWNIAPAVLAIVILYAIGHAIASISSFFIEQMLVKQIIGFPEEYLFKARSPQGLSRIFLSEYGRYLPQINIDSVAAEGFDLSLHDHRRAAFHHCFALAKAQPATFERIGNFSNVYGFCRNLALAMMFAALVCFTHYWTSSSIVSLNLSIASIILGIVLAFRYLRFLRYYTIEIFSSVF